MNNNSALYGEDEDQAAPSGQDEAAPQSDEKEQDGQGKTFLIEKAMLPADVQPGATLTIKITAVHDQECEAMVSEEGQDEASQEAAGEPEPAPDEAAGPGGMYG
jgi:hypothetical protein